MPGKPDIEYLVDLRLPWMRANERPWQFGRLEVGGDLCRAVIQGKGQKELRRNARVAWHQEQKRGATGDPTLILMEKAEPTSTERITGWISLRCLNCGARLLDIKRSATGRVTYKDYGERPRAAERRLPVYRTSGWHRFAPENPARRVRCLECNEEADWAFSPTMNWVRYRIIAPGRCLP